MPGGWVYIMTNRPNGTLYSAMTNDLARRIWEHREGIAHGFTKRPGLSRLVGRTPPAIQREKTMKQVFSAWKVRLIPAADPGWDDLFERVA